jgi:hypothetical protein
MIQVECPHCDKVLRLDEELAGSKSACPECGGRFRVPAEPDTGVTTEKSQPRPSADEGDDEDRPQPRRKWRFDVKPYRPDGGVTVMGVVLMLGIECSAGLLLGLLSGFIGHWFYLVLLFPILIGGGLGGVGILGIRLGRVRNPLVGGLIGFLGGCVASTSAMFVQYLFFLEQRSERRAELETEANWRPNLSLTQAPGDPHLARQVLRVKSFFGYIDFEARQGVTITSSSGSSTDKGMNLGYVGSYIYWGVEFLIMAGMAFFIMRKGTMRPYCRACQTWKKDCAVGSLRGRTEDVVAAVEDGKLDVLEEHEPTVKKSGDLRLHVAVCPNCRDESPVDVRLVQMVKVQGRDQPKDLTQVTYPGKALETLEEVFPGAKIDAGS